MKMLYAFQGTGNGHLSRAKEIIPILEQKGEVDILISGGKCDFEFPFEIKYQLQGLGFIFGKKGGIDFWASIKNANLKRVYQEIKTLPVKEYDLIINDFEPISAWSAKLKKASILSLSHQNAVLDIKSPSRGKYRLERFILKYYAPAKTTFGFHFKAYGSNIFTPIIRNKIRHANITCKEHYTVYLPAYSDAKICEILSKFKHIKWEIFSVHTDKNCYIKNITITPINERNFIKSMAAAKGVLCGAGFETPAEALFFKKKLLVVPMKNQYEQQCNAQALKEMGVPVLKKLNKKSVKKIKKWLYSTDIVTVEYPNYTAEFLDAIISPFSKTENLLITTN